MPDSYKYVDLDYIYTDPKTGILRNLANITDPEVLVFLKVELLQSAFKNFTKNLLR